MLTTEEINLIADAVALRLRLPAEDRPMPTKEAMQFLGIRTYEGFRSFVKKNRLKPAARNGRIQLWTRAQLVKA